MSKTVTWDGKDLAAIQALLAKGSRINGRPCYEVAVPDGAFDLTVTGIPVLVGQTVTLKDSGIIVISEPA